LVKSSINTGKTEAYINYLQWSLQKQPTLRILVITPRITMASDLLRRLNSVCSKDRFLLYLDSKSNMQTLQSAPRVIIQLDPLIKLMVGTSNYQKYDIVLIDESESILRHFGSHTMKRRGDVWRVFIHICQNAIQLLAFDANLGIRTYEILKNIRTNNINYKPHWFSSMDTNNTHNDGIRILVNSYCTRFK
jgi:hypothetical protein